MNFSVYLCESKDEQISIDDFIESLKEKGLYGYDVLKHFTEDELRSKITDDEYYNSNEKTDDSKDDKDKIEEMVLRGKPTTDDESETPKATELSLAVRLGLKKNLAKEQPSNDSSSNSQNLNTKFTFDKNKEVEEKKPQTFADKMREFAEQKRKEQLERQQKDKDLRDQRAKEAEERAKKEDVPELTFNGKSQTKQKEEDQKDVDKKLTDIEKELEKEMFKKTRASTKVDSDGYKSVSNISRITDTAAEKKLSKEMAKKFPSQDIPDVKKPKLGNSNQNVEKEAHIMSRNEYSKRTLLALASKVPDFSIYCKYRKLNGDIRTGNFTLLGAKSQVTNKQNTLVVIDQDLSKKENKKVYRTINLFKILEIKPL